MKYFIFTHGHLKIYIAAFSEENIIKEIEEKIFKRLTENPTIIVRKTELPIASIVRYLRRNPGDRLRVLGAKPTDGDYTRLQYAVLDYNSFSLVEDDTLSSELFYPQEELYKSLLTKPLDAIINPTDWINEVRLEKNDFIYQMGSLVSQLLLRPVYKINAPGVSKTENPWTENLSSLRKELQNSDGLIVDGGDPANILISFKRIA